MEGTKSILSQQHCGTNSDGVGLVNDKVDAPARKTKQLRKKKVAYRARHRLLSIHRDANCLSSRLLRQRRTGTFGDFLPDCASSWPVVANQRCGSWYVMPSSFSPTSSCYFKSTDGHVGTWNISLKRLNLSLINTIVENDHEGCFLVDSSVRKLLPDSLSRTIPIWACVLNRIVLKYRDALGILPPATAHDGQEKSWDINLYTPSCVVSPEEHLEVSNLIDSRVDCLFQSRAIVNPKELVKKLTRPLRPVWISNSGQILESLSPGGSDDFSEYFVIACVNPSTYIINDKNASTKSQIQWVERGATKKLSNTGFYYTPGAADDHESWARHLTPSLFWKHHKRILDTDLDDDQVDALIDALVEQEQQQSQNDDEITNDGKAQHPYDTTTTAFLVSGGSMDRIGHLNVWIGSRKAGKPPTCWNHFEAILNVTQQEYPDMTTTIEKEQQKSYSSRSRYNYLQLQVAEGKRDKTELERWMPVGLLFLLEHLQNKRRILIHCAQGKDRSVAMALALVVLVCRPLVFPLGLEATVEEETPHSGCHNRIWDLDTLRHRIVCDAANKSSCQESRKTRARTTNTNNNNEANGDTKFYLFSGLPQLLVNGLLQENGRELFLDWVHEQLQTPISQGPLANKESLRIGLQLLRQDREVADPTRSTLQKLNRFFMSSPLYRYHKGNKKEY